MPAGLQIFDANGNVILDATHRILRIIDSRQLVGGISASVIDDRFLQGGWVSFQPSITAGEKYLSGGLIVPQFQFSGNTLSWSWEAKNSNYDIYQEGTLFYGAY